MWGLGQWASVGWLTVGEGGREDVRLQITLANFSLATLVCETMNA